MHRTNQLNPARVYFEASAANVGLAQFTPELVEHIEWWRVYYHFVRYHESLKAPLAEHMVRKGKQTPQKYQRRTPAMAAGLTRRRWTVMEVISYPLL